MTEGETYARLTGVFHEVFDDDTIVLQPQLTAADVPGWDSQAHVMLVVATETRFGIRFNTAELERLHDVGGLVAAIRAKTA